MLDIVVFFWVVLLSIICLHWLLLGHVAVRDISKWSARMRKPIEEVYGAELFAKTWEGWVDGISHFAKRPEGTKVTSLQIVEPNEP